MIIPSKGGPAEAPPKRVAPRALVVRDFFGRAQLLMMMYCAVPGPVLEPKCLRIRGLMHSSMAVQMGRFKTGQCRWDD